MTTSTPITPFQVEIETIQEFLQRFTIHHHEILNNDKTTGSTKTAILIRALPVSVVTDIQRRIKPTLLTDAAYEHIEKHLISQFDIKKSVIGAAVKFINRKQKPGETIEAYAQSINNLASSCSYKDCCRDRLLRDIFVSGLNSGQIMATLLQECEDKTFNQCIQRAKTIEQLALDAADLNPGFIHSTNKIDYKHSKYSKVDSRIPTSEVPASYNCIRCGVCAKHFARNCPQIKATCYKCQKIGHLAKMCRNKYKVQAVQGDHYQENRDYHEDRNQRTNSSGSSHHDGSENNFNQTINHNTVAVPEEEDHTSFFR